MTTSKAAKLLAVLGGSWSVPVALAHPGHEHGPGLLEGLLHALESEWRAALLLLALSLVAGCLYIGKDGSG